MDRLAVNNYTQKMPKKYSGVWDEVTEAVNGTMDRNITLVNIMKKFSNGDLSMLEALKQVGEGCENDELLPAFTKMMEYIGSLIGEIGTLEQGHDCRRSLQAGR